MTCKTCELDQLSINTIRFLSADAIQKANSGHPGLPMGAAAMAYALWTRHLKHNPVDPGWADRDRFVLSGGHGSMLLYSLLHLTGYDLSLDDIKSFRQMDSKTPGHPESHITPGVEATTGPLGQGLSNAVGMAIAEAHLAARFNHAGHKVVDHFTYVLASDGDLMEGVTAEASSLAGHLGLGKLIALYDDNDISLAGATPLCFSEDVTGRYEAYGWHVLQVDDGNDLEAVDAAINAAKAVADKPSLIRVKTVIGFGAPKQGSAKVHGSPLGDEALAQAKEKLGWPAEPAFYVPKESLGNFRQAVEKGKAAQAAWQKAMDAYAGECPDCAAKLTRMLAGELPKGWDANLPVLGPDAKGIATRKAGEGVIQALAESVPELFGGSADLNPSTLTWLKGFGDFEKPGTSGEGVEGAVGESWGYEGRNIHFGVREHAMGSIAIGIALHGGLIPYTATFLPFADYMRPPMRLAALSGLRAVFVFTHDTIGLGEDGPTHQPIEQVMNMRGVPNFNVIRPADANETAQAWRAALLKTDGPTALVLSRQNLPTLDRTKYAPAENVQKGGYVLWDSAGGTPELILLAVGSEVHVALEAAHTLAGEGTAVRVVALPCWELFDEQPASYRESVLPSGVRARIAVEAGTAVGWEHYVGLDGDIIGMTTFGTSAPGKEAYAKFGFTAGNVVKRAKALLKK